jgi:hypothetical protein
MALHARTRSRYNGEDDLYGTGQGAMEGLDLCSVSTPHSVE